MGNNQEINNDLSKPLDIRFRRGDSLYLSVQSIVKQGNIEEEEDFTGSIFSMDVIDDSDKLILDASPFLTFEGNTLSIDITADESAKILPGRYKYEIRQRVSTLRYTRLNGFFIVQPNITK